jgi:hypothetical protein
MHGVAQKQPVLNTALGKALFNVRGNIDKCPTAGHLKPELFSIMLHKYVLGKLAYCVQLKEELKFTVMEILLYPIGINQYRGCFFTA